MNTTIAAPWIETEALRDDLRPSGTSPRPIPSPHKHPIGRLGGHQ
jgi:hypothetical protein